jgi:fructosamine-3-kinase
VTSRLLDPKTVGTVEEAVSAHIGHTWRISSWTDLAQRASHPAMILRDESYAVFAKLAAADEATLQVNSELAGLRLLAEFGIPVPVPVGSGRVDLADGSTVLLFEALVERTHRSTEDWQAIGRVLAALHAVEGGSYGAASDGFFGPLRLENAPVDPDTWVEFYTVRRVQPWLRTARDAGSVDAATAARVETLIQRLPQLAGPDPSPRLLHGDAQHHNFLSTDTGAVVIDASPYFGHPEIDLALLDYFSPVPPQTWSAYNEIRPIDKEFQQRRELWRVFAYLGILTVDPTSEFGRTFRPRLHSALSRYL